mgnify:CR=1 FL=1
MPPLIALAVAGAGLYFGWRWLKKEQTRIVADLDRARETVAAREIDRRAATARDVGRLEQDPATGDYRPK